MTAQGAEIPVELQTLVDQFIAFCSAEARLLDRVNLKQTRLTIKKGELFLHLPYVDRNRHKLRLRVTRKQETWVFSDDGITLEGTKRSVYERYLRQMLKWYGFQAHNGVQTLETLPEGFSGKCYTFIRVLRTLDHLVTGTPAAA